MIIYNTTYTIPIEEARNFVIWLHETYMEKIEKSNMLQEPKLYRILSHKDQESECFSLQFKVENTKKLHKWYIEQGKTLQEEMQKLFEGKVIGFSTLLEEI